MVLADDIIDSGIINDNHDNQIPLKNLLPNSYILNNVHQPVHIINYI